MKTPNGGSYNWRELKAMPMVLDPKTGIKYVKL